MRRWDSGWFDSRVFSKSEIRGSNPAADIIFLNKGNYLSLAISVSPNLWEKINSSILSVLLTPKIQVIVIRWFILIALKYA